jgi:signal transduction histidine kinase
MPETAPRTDHDHSLLATLDQVARIVEAAGTGTIDPEERARAQNLALTLANSGDGSMAGTVAPVVVFVASLLSDMAVDLAADVPAAARLLGELDQSAGLPSAALGHELLRSSRVWQLPADVGLHVQLTLVQLFTQARGVSVWTAPPGERPRRVGVVGDAGGSASEAERVAEALLGSAAKPSHRSDAIAGLAVERGQLPTAALVAEGSGVLALETDVLLEAAAPAIGAILDRIELLNIGGLDGPSVSSALERRLARLRYDLHDGPQQDVHLLGLDLRLFRDQLSSVIRDQPDGGRLMGRLDDLEAQLVALDSELRHISTSMQSPFLPAGTLSDALQDITEAFSSRSGIQPEVKLEGDFAGLTDSQQITLLALIREGLNNVQKHSGAERVTISLAAHDRGVDALLTDDGRGFDPETTLVQAAREGHLGVVGIHERVRMLGGHARIESRPGGPTVISVTLPSFRVGRGSAAPASSGTG